MKSNLQQEEKTPMNGYLCVDQLPSCVTTSDLHHLLTEWGGVRHCQVATDSSGSSLGFAFIETTTTRDAEQILQNLDGVPLFGRTVRVSRFDIHRA